LLVVVQRTQTPAAESAKKSPESQSDKGQEKNNQGTIKNKARIQHGLPPR